MRAISGHRPRTVEKVLNLAAAKNPEKSQRSSLDMLTRVFPFHNKEAVESALETCGGDVARAVQQLVGHAPIDEGQAAGTSSSEGTNSDNNTPSQPAFQPAAIPAPPAVNLYPSTSAPSFNPALSYPLRMMYPTSMMPFLHPSAAYFAAASQSWLFSNHHYRHQHVCLPGCTQCPPTSSSSSANNDNNKALLPITELELFKTRKDIFNKS